jgi:5,10-methenyltetrahydrofolate synthetase
MLTPPDHDALRKRLTAARQAMPDRLGRSEALQSVLRTWLVTRRESSIGAYWPIKGEFDPLPALYRWSEAAENPEAPTASAERIASMRRIGLPVADGLTQSLRFRVWYPGCPMEPDAYGIPKPKDTEEFVPQMLLVPCLGYGPAGVRLGYGGGFFERTLRTIEPHPVTVGLCFSSGFVPLLLPSPSEITLDAILTEDGVMWQDPAR